MKILIKSCQKFRQRGWALLTVMTLAGVGLMLLASVMSWSSQNSAVTARNNEYFATSYAAEAATEKVLANMTQEYENYGFSDVNANMATYQATIPTAADSSYWTNYNFSGGTTANSIIVTNTSVSNLIVMGAPYTGLTMIADTYEIIANAQNNNSQYNITATVGQQVNMGVIPLFQFAIFYQNDMEIAPGGNMYINGAVHGNQNIYIDPQAQMVFSNTVSAVANVYENQSPLDPTVRTFSGVTFNTPDLSGVDPLNLPVGTNNTGTVSNVSQNAYAILELPTSDETPGSQTGENLLYNKADMIVVVSNNNTISVTSGAGVNNQATVIPTNQWQNFISTNGSFYDQRDSLTVNPVVINVSNLVAWSATNQTLNPVLAGVRGAGQGDVQSIYVIDERNTTNAVVTTNYTMTTNFVTNSGTTTASSLPASYVIGGVSYYAYVYPASPPYSFTINYTTNKSTKKVAVSGYTYYGIKLSVITNANYLTNYVASSQPGIVLSNGAVLPPNGLSIATPDPAYVDGNWNIKTSSSGSSDAGLADTTYTRPSAIYADAITILSSAWNPNNSALSLSSRNATSDTVNAAFLTGNVPSNGTYYSGGVENFPRFLENWNSQTFTYNGSMVNMFPSQIATAHWPGTGTVYNPPTRNWAFDKNFNTPSKQPPLQPQMTTVQRSKWVLLPPNATSF